MTLARRQTQAFIRSEADKAFHEAHLRGQTLPCEGKPKLYSDFKPSQRPTPEGAARLCGVGTPWECPVLQACRDKAHHLPAGAADGVYGGQVWIDGVIQTD